MSLDPALLFCCPEAMADPRLHSAGHTKIGPKRTEQIRHMSSDEPISGTWSPSRPRSRTPKRSNCFEPPPPTSKTVKHPNTVKVWAAFLLREGSCIYFLPKNANMNGKWYQEVLQNQALTAAALLEKWRIFGGSAILLADTLFLKNV